MMDLFNKKDLKDINLLPQDGVVNYYGNIMSVVTADRYLNCLMKTIDWKPDEAMIFGKRILTKRKVAWYADTNFKYTYSGTNS
ncbi:MAG: hypothetical protein EOO92_08940 [Pedobacter sp.]|nr:MAG: hypothetical protein EOO92_08940 [Pedobacter sp.]